MFNNCCELSDRLNVKIYSVKNEFFFNENWRTKIQKQIRGKMGHLNTYAKLQNQKNATSFFEKTATIKKKDCLIVQSRKQIS